MRPVSLFTREWIEIISKSASEQSGAVSLFTREWIEIAFYEDFADWIGVSLFTREWIEISSIFPMVFAFSRLPLYEGVD